MKKWLLILATLYGLLVQPAFAVKMASLYQAELPVATQSSDERLIAVKQGLIQVLTKLSGDPSIETNRAIKPALRKADYYVEEFSYYNSPSSERNKSDNPQEADNGLMSSQYYIHIRYNKDDINNLLKKARISVWSDRRPLVLVWLASGAANHEAAIVGNETPGGLLDAMKSEATRYGLPLIFPAMDMNDISQVSVNDVTGMAITTLREASKRYQPDAYLVGSIEQNNDEFKSDWQLVVNDHHWTWTITNKSTDVIIKTVLNDISQTLAKNYVTAAASNEQQHWINIEVSNVKEKQELTQVMSYVKQLNSVERVQLSEVNNNAIQLSILVSGPLETFQQNASLGRRLVLKSGPAEHDKLMYEWVH